MVVSSDKVLEKIGEDRCIINTVFERRRERSTDNIFNTRNQQKRLHNMSFVTVSLSNKCPCFSVFLHIKCQLTS